MQNVFQDITQVALNIKSARTRAGMTQRGLAELVGIDPTYIAHIERGARWPSLYTLCRVARALKIKPAKLLHGLV